MPARSLQCNRSQTDETAAANECTLADISRLDGRHTTRSCRVSSGAPQCDGRSHQTPPVDSLRTPRDDARRTCVRPGRRLAAGQPAGRVASGRSGGLATVAPGDCDRDSCHAARLASVRGDESAPVGASHAIRDARNRLRTLPGVWILAARTRAGDEAVSRVRRGTSAIALIRRGFPVSVEH